MYIHLASRFAWLGILYLRLPEILFQEWYSVGRMEEYV